MGGKIRDASVTDGERCAEIFARYVTDTTVTLETEPPATEQMAERIAKAIETHSWLVVEDEGYVVGYAYGGPFATIAAYRFACQVAVYLEPARHGTGVAHRLYNVLLSRLSARGYRVALASIPLPNDNAFGLHRATGFKEVGVHRQIARKHDTWRDVMMMQRAIGPVTDPPLEPQ